MKLGQEHVCCTDPFGHGNHDKKPLNDRNFTQITLKQCCIFEEQINNVYWLNKFVKIYFSDEKYWTCATWSWSNREGNSHNLVNLGNIRHKYKYKVYFQILYYAGEKSKSITCFWEVNDLSTFLFSFNKCLPQLEPRQADAVNDRVGGIVPWENIVQLERKWNRIVHQRRGERVFFFFFFFLGGGGG